jgi:hypothetical protein
MPSAALVGSDGHLPGRKRKTPAMPIKNNSTGIPYTADTAFIGNGLTRTRTVTHLARATFTASSTTFRPLPVLDLLQTALSANGCPFNLYGGLHQ